MRCLSDSVQSNIIVFVELDISVKTLQFASSAGIIFSNFFQPARASTHLLNYNCNLRDFSKMVLIVAGHIVSLHLAVGWKA